MRTIATTSGTVYLIDGDHILRTDGDGAVSLRGDADWLHLLEPIPDESQVGRRLRLALEPLNVLGPDTYGRRLNASSATVRESESPRVRESESPRSSSLTSPTRNTTHEEQEHTT